MSRSKREIPHYYLSLEIDTGPAQEWLARYNAEHEVTERMLFGVLPLKAVALALREYPQLNGCMEEIGFRQAEEINIGVAVALRGGGLVAPAIHAADTLALPALMRAFSDLVDRVRSGHIRASELADPTITVTSLGELGVDAVFPIIYPPQVAIVGFGSVSTRPWVVNGEVVARPVIRASLAGDHRVSDGRLGARFLDRVAQLLATPEVL
jgi:pyruvate dehydrogenase E2 component (dihydrolipoamide acetyltransferase)